MHQYTVTGRRIWLCPEALLSSVEDCVGILRVAGKSISSECCSRKEKRQQAMTICMCALGPHRAEHIEPVV